MAIDWGKITSEKKMPVCESLKTFVRVTRNNGDIFIKEHEENEAIFRGFLEGLKILLAEKTVLTFDYQNIVWSFVSDEIIVTNEADVCYTKSYYAFFLRPQFT